MEADRLNQVEREVLWTLLLVRAVMAEHAVSVVRYTEMMASVRAGIVLLENKLAGCAWGLHASSCTCTVQVRGQNFDYKKYGRRQHDAKKTHL